jgi:hypothetical protein
MLSGRSMVSLVSVPIFFSSSLYALQQQQHASIALNEAIVL